MTLPSLSKRFRNPAVIAGAVASLVVCPSGIDADAIVPRPDHVAGEVSMRGLEAARYVSALDDEQLLTYLRWLDDHPLGSVFDTRMHAVSYLVSVEPYQGGNRIDLAFYARPVDEGKRLLMWLAGKRPIDEALISAASSNPGQQLRDFGESISARYGTALS